MRILLVKTSSLGDVIHNLPVVTDLAHRHPQACIDWCVEEGFREIPALHPALAASGGRIIPVAIRRWRRTLWSPATWREIAACSRQLAATPYDAILDTQGLLKSALISRLARGRRLGYDAASAREPIAARTYDAGFAVPRDLHAVLRNRRLAAAALDTDSGAPLDYGIAPAPGHARRAEAVLLTATSRDDKLWPETDWIALGQALAGRGLAARLPAGTPRERARAERIAAAIPGASLLPPASLTELAGTIGRARLAIGVDTGLVHLAAALNTPAIALFTASDPARTGVLGAGFVANLGGIGRPPAVAEVLASVEAACR